MIFYYIRQIAPNPAAVPQPRGPAAHKHVPAAPANPAPAPAKNPEPIGFSILYEKTAQVAEYCIVFACLFTFILDINAIDITIAERAIKYFLFILFVFKGNIPLIFVY